MTSKRLHSVLIAVLVLLFVGLVGGAYGINKLLVTQSNKLLVAKAKNQALDQEQVSLNRAKKDIQKYSGLNKIAESVVPQDKNQAEAVREIVNIASSNSLVLASINFPASTLGNLPNGTASAGSAAAGSGAASPAAASANSKTSALSQLTPLRNIPGVYQLPITINNDANHPIQYDKFISFLSDLEHNRRTSQVQTITIQPSATSRGAIIFSLTLNEYIKP